MKKLIVKQNYYSEESPIIKNYKGLCNFLFSKDCVSVDIRENNIGIMIKTLFQVNESISEKLHNKYKLHPDEIPKYINELIGKLSFILKEMLKEKEKDDLFYLISPSFIADLHSLFNNLLSILISLRKNELTLADMGKDKNILNIKDINGSGDTLFMKKDIGLSEEEINLLHYVKKKRAQFVHKERKNITQELTKKSFHKFNNIGLFRNSISNVILKFFSLIDKEI